MRNFALKSAILILIILINNIVAYPQDQSSSGWDDMLEFDRSWQTNHEAVTDADFEKVMQRFEKKKKPKKYEFEPNSTKDSLNDMSILNDISNHSPIILFPVNSRSYEGQYIPAGHYKLNYLKKNNKHYIVVSQGRKIYTKLEMSPTKENFNSETIQFAEIKPINNEMVKLIYGNLDLNLEKTLYIVN